MRIEHSTAFLSSVANMLQNGQLFPAAFQRPYVWTQEDVLSLAESIFAGYPVGGLLLWTPGPKADLTKVMRTRLGPISFLPDKINTDYASILLDGQNRLASLAWLSRKPEMALPVDLTEHERAVWADDQVPVLDLVQSKLLFLPSKEASTGLRIPAYALFGEANPLVRKLWGTQWAEFSDEDKDAGLKRLDTFAAAFQNARVVVTNLLDADVNEAKHAFVHICKVGVPMTEQEFNTAVAWAE